ncbi:MAG: hypothetical protein ACTTH7_09740 [Treponema sp.]
MSISFTPRIISVEITGISIPFIIVVQVYTIYYSWSSSSGFLSWQVLHTGISHTEKKPQTAAAKLHRQISIRLLRIFKGNR